MKKTDIINIIPMKRNSCKHQINKKYNFIDKKEYDKLLGTLKTLYEETEEKDDDYSKEIYSLYKDQTIIDRELLELIIYYLEYLEN